MRPWSGGRRSACEVDAQPLQWTLDVADRVDGDPRIERRRFQLGVSEACPSRTWITRTALSAI